MIGSYMADLAKGDSSLLKCIASGVKSKIGAAVLGAAMALTPAAASAVDNSLEKIVQKTIAEQQL